MLGLLRVLRDVGIVAVVVLILRKVATEGGDDAPSEATPPGSRVERLPVMTNSLGMILVRIPPGEFRMGSSSYSRETTVHPVRLGAGFWMGRNEVTQAEFREVMGSSPSGFRGDTLPVERIIGA